MNISSRIRAGVASAALAVVVVSGVAVAATVTDDNPKAEVSTVGADPDTLTSTTTVASSATIVSNAAPTTTAGTVTTHDAPAASVATTPSAAVEAPEATPPPAVTDPPPTSALPPTTIDAAIPPPDTAPLDTLPPH